MAARNVHGQRLVKALSRRRRWPKASLYKAMAMNNNQPTGSAAPQSREAAPTHFK